MSLNLDYSQLSQGLMRGVRLGDILASGGHLLEAPAPGWTQHPET